MTLADQNTVTPEPASIEEGISGSGSPHCYPIRVRLTFAVQCQDKRFQVAKTVLMPALLPIGSEVFLTNNTGEGEIGDFEVTGYYWSESDAYIMCDIGEATYNGKCEYEWPWLQAMGWEQG